MWLLLEQRQCGEAPNRKWVTCQSPQEPKMRVGDSVEFDIASESISHDPLWIPSPGPIEMDDPDSASL